MEEIRFTMQLTEVEYCRGQRLASTERPINHFFLFTWPAIACTLGILAFVVALIVEWGGTPALKGGSAVAGAFVGSAVWGYYTVLFRIPAEFRRNESLRHGMTVLANDAGVALECETGSKSFVPWRNLTKILDDGPVIVLMLTFPRFAILSSTDIDESLRLRFIAFARAQILTTRGGVAV